MYLLSFIDYANLKYILTKYQQYITILLKFHLWTSIEFFKFEKCNSESTTFKLLQWSFVFFWYKCNILRNNEMDYYYCYCYFDGIKMKILFLKFKPIEILQFFQLKIVINNYSINVNDIKYFYHEHN